MATFDNDLRLKEIISGDEDGTWGDSTNLNLELIANAFSYGTEDIPTDGDVTVTIADGVADDARSLVLEITSTASLTATRTVTLAPSSVSKAWFIKNSTTGGQSITIAQGSGSTVTVANGKTVGIYTDGAGVTAAVTQLQTKDDFNLGATDSPTFADLTLTGNLGAVDGTFTGNVAVTGTVDGRDVATDGTKLDGIEPNATADQTAAEIKTAYESNADTNAFTDSEKTKLGTVESGADVTDATNVDAAGAVMNTDTTTAAMGFVVDEDDMASNSDTKVPTQQSTRAYVDNTVTSIGALATSGSPVATDYARFTHPSRIEGRSPAEVLSDINAQEDLSGLVLTPAVVASTDKVLIQDTDDSDNLKTINVADILASVGNTYAKTEFTATGGQTDFTVSYIVGLVDVYLNGICLDSTEFTATNGTSIVLAAGATAGDKLKVISWETFEVLNGLTTSDIGVTVQAYDATLLNAADIGVTVQGFDATTLKSADIGVTVQGFDATTLKSADIGVTVQADLSGAALTGVTAQSIDKILIQDASDSDNLKTIPVSTFETGPSITATASGALADGDPVVVNDDGTVSVVSGFTQNIGTAQDTGTDLDGASSSDYVSMCYDESADRVLLVYVENTTGNSHALVGNVGANSITWGTPTLIYAAAAGAAALVYYPTENLSVWFRYNVDDFHLITISGSTPSAGTPQVFTDMQKNLAAIYHPVEDKIVAAGRRLVTGYLAFGALDITAGVPSTGTILTGSGNTVLTNDDPEDTNLTYDSVNNDIVCISSDDSAVVYILSLSGTTLTEVAKCDPPGGSLAALNISQPNVIYDPSNNKYLFVYRDTNNSSYYTIVVGVRNGNEFAYGVPVVLSRSVNGRSMLQLSHNPDSEKIILTFKDGIGLKIANVDLSEDEPIIGQLYSIENTGGGIYPRNNWPYDSTAKRTVLYHLQGSDIYTTVYRPEYGNLSTQRFIGFSDGAYLDTETANIQVVGSVDDAQTGLTTGKKHYVQIDGTISTAPAETAIEAGTALSATEILIKG